MSVILKVISLLAVMMLTACTIVDGGAIITGVARDPISLDQVRVYRVTPEKYEEIAMISASAGHDFKSNSSLIESAITKLKEEAAKLGANGVLLAIIDERDTPSTTVSYGAANAFDSNGAAIYASGNNISVNRGDTYTRMKALAIYVP